MQIEHRMDAKRGNLIWLSDGRTEAAAALDFGIRIVHLSCAGKPNLFYSQPDDLSDGLATEAGWRIYGGHRFWSSPESTRSYYPDNAPVACELLADGVCLRQRTDPWTGFEKTLILRFLPAGRHGKPRRIVVFGPHPRVQHDDARLRIPGSLRGSG